MGKSEKVGSNSCLYSDTKKSENVLNEKQKQKREHAFKVYASTYFYF